MRSMLPPGGLTRVVVDAEHECEMAQLESARQRIERAVIELQSALPADMPQEQREYIANALLDLAVSRVPYTVAFRRAFGRAVS